MRRLALVTALCIVLSAGLASCGKNAFGKDNVYLRFTDDLSREISLADKPERVAVLFSSFADVWLIAGGEIRITVGEAVERGFADDTTPLVDSGAGKTVNTELLISYAPDFVICSADIAAQADAARLLNSVGIPAACFRIESFDDYLRVLGIFTDITQNKEAYKTYGTDVGEGIQSLLANIKQIGEGPKILFIRAGSSARSTKAKTAKEHFACAMLDELGSYNIANAAPVLIDGLSIEEILNQDPDVIFITSMGNEEASREYVTSLFAGDVWQSLAAVKNGKYYFLPKDLFQYKPNAKWLEAYEILAEMLYEEEIDQK